MKKISPLGSLYGLTLETGLVFPACVGLPDLYPELWEEAHFGHTGMGSDLLLIGAGVVTTIPLLMFASAARRIPLTMVGIMQYIAPTIQFLMGIFFTTKPLQLQN